MQKNARFDCNTVELISGREATRQDADLWYSPSIMTEVAIQPPDELSQFVNDSVQSAYYRTKDELFVSVLSIYREQVEASRTEAGQSKLADLRHDVQVAVDQLDRGEGIRNRNWDEKLAERRRAYAARHPA